MTESVAPLFVSSPNGIIKKTKNFIPPNIKAKINKRKRLLKLDRLRQSSANAPEIKTLTNGIKSYFFKSKINKVRNATMGNHHVSNLWRSVKIAKNLNYNSIPSNMTLNGLPLNINERADAFATFFNEKTTSHARNSKICPNVYNGTNKIIVQNRMNKYINKY